MEVIKMDRKVYREVYNWSELVKSVMDLEELVDEWLEEWGGVDEVEEVELVELFEMFN